MRIGSIAALLTTQCLAAPLALHGQATFDPRIAGAPGVHPAALTTDRVFNLVLLGKVWGFVKYHHPRVAGGALDWDRELVGILPAVHAAEGRTAAITVLSDWLAAVGDPPQCDPCAAPPAELHLAPPIAWIRDRESLGELSDRLQRIHANRFRDSTQRYVALAAFVGNPDFSGEAPYAGTRLPNADHRLLALFRFWNIIEYWFPYRDVIGEDWDGVLAEFVPRLLAADDATRYRLEMMQLVARINDSHANLWSALELRPPTGPAQLPVVVRFLGGRAVVSGYTHAELGPATGLEPGDVIEALDNARVDSLVAAWRPYYGASNEVARLRDIAFQLTRGPAGPVRVRVRRDGRVVERTASRVPRGVLDLGRARTNALPGEAFQRLSDDVAYLKLVDAKAADAAEYVRGAAGAEVLVIDIRGYPREFMVFALGNRLVRAPTPIARFTNGDLPNPGAFGWTPPIWLRPVGADGFDSGAFRLSEPVTPLSPPEPAGPTIVVLVDENTQSQAEYTAMALRAVPGAVVVGSTTAGADGNVSEIPLPGGLRAMISGIGVFYPDGRPTQRIGILPDLVVHPTLEGIRAGRDEVLERAVSHVLGREFRLPVSGT